jgi:hypothetical protein
MEWSLTSSREIRVANSRINEWEYQENEVIQGYKYKELEAVKKVVKLWSNSLRN